MQEQLGKIAPTTGTTLNTTGTTLLITGRIAQTTGKTVQITGTATESLETIQATQLVMQFLNRMGVQTYMT